MADSDLPPYSLRQAAATAPELPAYAATGSGAAASSVRPPAPSSPPSSRGLHLRPTYTVGRKKTPALITVVDLKAHLTLLRAFRNLRDDVTSRARKAGVVPPEEAWRWYVLKAIWRFELWLAKVVKARYAAQGEPAREGENGNEIPPVDVILVWHTYLLVRNIITLRSGQYSDRCHSLCSAPTYLL